MTTWDQKYETLPKYVLARVKGTVNRATTCIILV